MTQTQEEELVSNEVQSYVEKVVKELGVKEFTINISAGSIRGDNYLGIIAKVQVQGRDNNNKNVILNFIVKSAPRGGLFRKFSPIHSAYDREIYIYSKVLPEFTKLQEERGVLSPFKSFAKYYGSTLDDMNEALILENMKEIGFKLWNRHQPLNYDHVMLVLKEYGKFHALSFAMRDQKPELFKELSENTQEEFFKSMLNNFEAMEDSMKMQNERSLNALDPVTDKVAYDRFKNFQNNVFDTVKKAVSAEPAGKYAVIGHGDCWVNNMLFKYENTSKPQVPSEVCLLDWQLARLGSPALDLSYFIFTCSDKELRDQHYDDFIIEYYNSFSSHLCELGSDPEKLFPFEVLQDHLKHFSVYGLYMTVMVLFAVTSEVEELPDLNKITDMEEIKEKFQYEPKNIDKYNSRVRGAVLDFIRLGYDF